MGSAKTIITTLLAPVLAGSITAAAAQTPEPTTPIPAPACRLIVSDETKKLYPEGLLELGAKHCWAGPATDIVVLGKDDVMRGDRNHMMITARTMTEARQNLLKFLPQDVREKFTSIRSREQITLLDSIAGAALRPSNSHAFKYKFEGQRGQPDRNIFITVTDDIYHVHDEMAAMAGVYLGSFINPRLYEELTNRESMRAKTFAHEAGHGKGDDGLIVISKGRVDLAKSATRNPLDSLRGETRADRTGNEYVSAAIKADIKISEYTSLIDHGLRALSVYFSYGTEVPHGVSLDDYDKQYAKAYITNPNILPRHATSAGLLTPQQPDAKEQGDGALEFRAAMNETLGKLFFDSATGQTYQFSDDIEKTYGRDIAHCEVKAEALPQRMKAKDAKAPLNAATLVGQCLAHGTFTRSFAVNALIKLEDQNYIPKNQYAKTYLHEFSEAIRTPFVTGQFLSAAAHYYIDHQRAHVQSPEVKARWDKLFVETGLMSVESAPAAPAPGGSK